MNTLFDLLSILCICLRVSWSSVIQFGIKTKSGHQNAGSAYGATLTLSFKKALYQCAINPTHSATEYVCEGDDSLISYECQDKQEMFIQNHDNRPIEQDALIISNIFIIDSLSGKTNYDLTNDLCLDEYECGSNSALVTMNTATLDTTTDITKDEYVSNCVYNPVNSFGIKTSNHQNAGNSYGVTLTLSYNKAIYQCIVYSTNSGTEYSCNGVESLIGYQCQDTQEMFIENNDNRYPNINGVIIANIFIVDSSGKKNYVLSNDVCLDEYECGSNSVLLTINSDTMSAISDKSQNEYIPNCVYDQFDADREFAERFAPYLRFDTDATNGDNGFPTMYNYPNGVESTQNMNSDISTIPTYYHIFRSDSHDPTRITSIGYWWYYSFQIACAYEGIIALDSLRPELQSAITGTITDLDFIDPEDIGQHNNDREKIFVNLDNDNTIKSVTFHQHSGKYTVLLNNGLETYYWTHPSVYIGRTSHGSYHKSMFNIGGCGYFHDHRDGSIKRESWLNLKNAFWINNDAEREDDWNNSSFCDAAGCDWDKCKTSDEVNKNAQYCTPLQCNNWKTSCLVWGLSDVVQAAPSINDKYFIFDDTGQSDCSCTSTIFGNVCAGEHIEGKVCTPDFAAKTIPNHGLRIDNYNLEMHPNEKKNIISIRNSFWSLLIGGLVVILLLINCSMIICRKCIFNKKRNNIYQSVRFDSESEEEFDEQFKEEMNKINIAQ